MPVAPDVRAAQLRAGVVGWFADHGRDLPWRAEDRTGWGVLVSEVMLQQTPVVRVLPAWLSWMARWPAAPDLAAASTADVLRAWGNLGYPRRALRLHECARVVTDRHRGSVPTDEATLLALPGIGAYTAAAVVAFAHGGRSVVLDTNVRRVLARIEAGRARPAPHLTTAELAQAGTLVPADPAEAAAWAAASMELGALVCTARAPRCDSCPVARLCRWRQVGQPADDGAHRRRTQAWAGTDRQARGQVMAQLRAAGAPVSLPTLQQVWPDRAQLDRCLRSLVADGLVEAPTAASRPMYQLPLSPAR